MKKNFYSALYLVVVCIIIFIIQVMFPAATDSLKLTSSLALIKPWTLITSIFLHGSIVHLLYNMFALALFGLILENLIGSRKFLLLFFLSGLFAGMASIPFYNSVLGASGAIFGIIGALAVLKPKMMVFVYGLPMPMILASLIWVGIDILGVFVPSDIANIAHLSGILVGIVFGIVLRFLLIIKEPKGAL